MGFILLIAAAILYFAGPWFSGQDTVAIILAIAGVAAIVFQLILFTGIAKKHNSMRKDFNDRWNRF